MHQLSWDHKIESIRGLAIIAVIGIHTISNIFIPLSRTELKQTIIVDAVYLGLLFAVPAFLITSGYLYYKCLRDAPYNEYSILYRRITGLLPLYLIFSTIYYFYTSNKLDLQKILWTFTHGSTNFTYYFIPMIIIFYIIGFIVYKNSALLRAVTGASVILQAIIAADTFKKVIPLPELIANSPSIILNKQFLFHVGFFLVGMVWAKNKTLIDRTAVKYKAFILLIALLGLEGSIGEFLFLNAQQKFFLESHTLAKFFSLIYVYAIFFSIYYSISNKSVLFVHSFGRHSYIVYLTHLPILQILNATIIRIFPTNFIIITFLSLAASLLIQITILQIYSKSTSILFSNNVI